MQYIQRYSIKIGMAGAYVKWLQDHATVLAEQAPDGWTYLGTWHTVRGLGVHDCETRWELTDYAALGSGMGTEAFQKALVEVGDFLDPADRGEQALMKSTDDILLIPGM